MTNVTLSQWLWVLAQVSVWIVCLPLLMVRPPNKRLGASKTYRPRS